MKTDQKVVVFPPFFQSFSLKNEICSLMRRSRPMSPLCKARSVSTVTALLRLVFCSFKIQISVKQIWVAATEICVSRDEVSGRIGGSPMGLKIPRRDLCSCYSDLGSSLLRFSSTYGMFRFNFGGKLVIYNIWRREFESIIAVLLNSQVTQKVMTDQFLTTALSGIGRSDRYQIDKATWPEMLGENSLSDRVRKRQFNV